MPGVSITSDFGSSGLTFKTVYANIVQDVSEKSILKGFIPVISSLDKTRIRVHHNGGHGDLLTSSGTDNVNVGILPPDMCNMFNYVYSLQTQEVFKSYVCYHYIVYTNERFIN